MEEEITRRVQALVQSSGLTETQARVIIEKVIQHFALHPLRLRDLLGTLPASALPPGTVYPTGTPAAGAVPTYDAVTGTTVWAAPAGGGAVATDAIWDAAGDLAVGSGANTAARMAKGTALQVLRVNSGATALEWATPSSGASNLAGARYRRTAGDYTTSSTSFVDVDGTNLALPITTGARRVLITLAGGCTHSLATGYIAFDVAVDGTRLGGDYGLFVAEQPSAAEVLNASFSVITEVLTAAAHTFKLQWRTNAATATLYGATAYTTLVFAVTELYAA